jgi:hypothetical protein
LPKEKKKHSRGWGFVEFVHLKIKENIDEKDELVYIGSSFSSLCNNATNNDNGKIAITILQQKKNGWEQIITHCNKKKC